MTENHYQIEFKIKDEDIASIMRDPQSERLGITRVSPADMRAMLEAENGAWFLSVQQLAELPEKEVIGRSLLLGCDAAVRYQTKQDTKLPPPREKQSVFTALRERTEKAQRETKQEGDSLSREEKLPNLPPEPPQPKSLEEEGCANNAQVDVSISKDKLSVSVCLVAPRAGGRAMTEEELQWNIIQSGVRVGIDDRFIERLVQFPVYGRSFHVAQGKPAQHGQDGMIKLFFDEDIAPRPLMDENGNMDYKEMGVLKNVSKGDVLCEIIQPSEAVDGWDVEGTILPAKKGKVCVIQAGHNVVLSEDGRYMIALCDGQPILKGGQLSVNEMLTVTKVDNTTGNIKFFGSVTVLGDVSSGFTVNAGGDILVKGFVESAQLVASGNVVLQKGMNGAGTGTIEAGLSVRSKFLEQVIVHAGKNVYGDVMLNCDIKCDGRMLLSGTKGCVSGGYCRARKEIQVDMLGNEAELETRAEVRDNNGVLDEIEKMQTLSKTMETVNKRMDLLLQLMRSMAMDLVSKRTAMVRAVFIRERMTEEIRRMSGEMISMRRKMQQSGSVGQIVVYKRIYPNVQMMIDGIALRNTVMKSACVVRGRDGEVVFDVVLPPRRMEREE